MRGCETSPIVPLDGYGASMLPADIDALVAVEIEKGARTPGAVATAAHLGVTSAYQSIFRLTAAGRILQAKAGSLSIPRSLLQAIDKNHDLSIVRDGGPER